MYEYAEPVTEHGFVYMDTPGYDPVSATGQVAGGANMICFTTGRGSAYGCAPSPSLKLATNSALWQRQEEDMDINCGEIIDGKVSIQEMGQRIFELVLATASGEHVQERAARLRPERVRALAGRRGDVVAEWPGVSDVEDLSQPRHCARKWRPSWSRPAAAPKRRAPVADNLVLANLSGHDSHGVGMVPRYVDAVLEGGLKPNASAKVNARCRRACWRSTGSAATARSSASRRWNWRWRARSERAAASWRWPMRITSAASGTSPKWPRQQGLVSIHFVNVLSRPMVAPWGGADGRFGTNPCCIGIPLQGREPFVLDFATSRVAQGKMRVAHNEGRRVEPGYLIDEHGRPTTDPGVVVVPQTSDGAGLFGALLPFGEHKGYGMAVACELLGGALTGSGTWHRPADTARSVINGMLTILIDPQKLGTRDSFEQEALAFVDWLKQSPPAPGFDRVRIAGEPEREARAQARARRHRDRRSRPGTRSLRPRRRWARHCVAWIPDQVRDDEHHAIGNAGIERTTSPATGKIRSPARGSMRCMPVKLPNAGSTPTACSGSAPESSPNQKQGKRSRSKARPLTRMHGCQWPAST